jgi:hypothetical protein
VCVLPWKKVVFFSVSNWPFGGVPVDPNRLFLLLLVKDFHVCPFYFSSSFFLERVQFLFIFCSRGGGDGMEWMNPALSVRLVISLDFIKFLVENEQS